MPNVHSSGRMRQEGVTLIELMVALGVLAVLVALAVPSFREISINNRSANITNTLLADLAAARSEATKQQRPVTVRASAGGWSAGWELFLDFNGDGEINGDDVQLKTAGDINQGHGPNNAFDLTSDADEITYGGMGQLQAPNAVVVFSLCRPDGDADKSSGIRIDLNGRAQSFKGVGGC